MQIFKTSWLKSETGGFENINPNTRMRPLENLSARPDVTGLQFAQMIRAWDQSLRFDGSRVLHERVVRGKTDGLNQRLSYPG
jgi:hypothetical protein